MWIKFTCKKCPNRKELIISWACIRSNQADPPRAAICRRSSEGIECITLTRANMIEMKRTLSWKIIPAIMVKS